MRKDAETWTQQVLRRDLRPLLVLLGVNVLATVLHYVDNICYFSDYPEPSWLNPCIIDLFWFVMTPFAILGYWYHTQRWTNLATVSLIVYSLMSLLVLGHYLISPPWDVSLRINAFILLEAFAAFVLIWYSIRLQRRLAMGNLRRSIV